MRTSGTFFKKGVRAGFLTTCNLRKVFALFSHVPSGSATPGLEVDGEGGYSQRDTDVRTI